MKIARLLKQTINQIRIFANAPKLAYFYIYFLNADGACIARIDLSELVSSFERKKETFDSTQVCVNRFLDNNMLIDEHRSAKMRQFVIKKKIKSSEKLSIKYINFHLKEL
ncbi:hypothetical protein BpHYR1_048752 [Brachionus plicatilis]|uniref:Uncharacterized protein n=1 Tax=Brachionus plicatilis TaxID=10195 RepID=A0A3M7PDB4_BRAPC|nr:hypothetical protein BpHYR1_048752 [Brachionus plicatilis]